MAKSETHTGKLLDHWTPPPNSGEPVGCIATSFTFESDFFEEECLSRFLKMDTDPYEDGPLYLIEREEKLAPVDISALVDQAHCMGKRSLQWDLISFRSTNLLHSKISVLAWSRHVRIIIGSGNLTRNGYRVNKEIFGVFDFSEEQGLDKKNLNQSLTFFTALLSVLDDDNPAVRRALNLLERISELASGWSKQIYQIGTASKILMTGQGYPRLITQIGNEARKAGNGVTLAQIVSPFYVDPNAPNPAVKQLIRQLDLEQNPALCWYGRFEDNGEENKLFYGPASLRDEAEALNKRRISFYGIEQTGKDEKDSTVNRPVHLKCIWLETINHVFYCIGSSNFTTNGLGISQRPNFESNILYTVDKTKARKSYGLLKGSFPNGINLGSNVSFCQDELLEDERPPEDGHNLPLFFRLAVFDCEGDRRYLKLDFDVKENPNCAWKILDSDKQVLYTLDDWLAKKSAPSQKVEWHQSFIPSELLVLLENGELFHWSVIAKDSSILPAPEELGELDLELLIQLLATNEPMYRAMGRWLKKKPTENDFGQKELINPHDKVDVSGFLLRRTRKISYAYSMLRSKLERPIFSKAALHWRFNGPVGVSALAKAILKEAHSEEEKIFLLAELCLELSDIKPQTCPGSLTEQVVYGELKSIINKLIKQSKAIENKNQTIGDYSKEAFKKSIANVRL